LLKKAKNITKHGLKYETMIEEKLEIVLITYNRYKDLENTLKQFLDGPFSECRFTILDNCSDDKTPEVCSKYEKLFTNMIIKRHKKNIGGNANILRGVETSNSLYSWVICDDDDYDFSDCSDVIQAIDSEEYYLISPGSPGEEEWERGLSTTVKKLIEKGSHYFVARSFVPGIIFKTESFDSICLVEGYANAHNLFPLFPFTNKSLENDYSIYTSKKRIITAGTHNNASYSGIYFITGWINSCSMIKDKDVRKKTIYTPRGGRSLLLRIFIAIALEKISRKEDVSKNSLSLIFSIMSTFGWSIDVLMVFLILPVAVIPRFLYNLFFKFYIYLNYGVKGKSMPSEWNYLFSDNENTDPLRKF
jgi:glycosyltransferase involved in cell wall biosynthesis